MNVPDNTHESGLICMIRGKVRPACEDPNPELRRTPAPKPAPAVPPVPPTNYARRVATAAPEPEDDRWEAVKTETLSDGRTVTTERPRRTW